MKIQLIFVSIFIFLGMVLFFTNPSLEKHKEFAENNFLDSYEKPNYYIKELIHVVAEEKVFRDSYGFFSLTKFDDLGVIKTIGFGCFGNVISFSPNYNNITLIIFTIIGFFLTLYFLYENLKLE